MLINLLPWRRQHYQQRRKKFIYILGLTLIVNLFLYIAIHEYFSHQIDFLTQENLMAVEKNSNLIREVKKIQQRKIMQKDILERNHTVLQKRNMMKAWSEQFDQLTKISNRQLQWVQLTGCINQWKITGVVLNTHAVAALLKNIQALSWVKSVELGQIKQNASNQSSQDFLITISGKSHEDIRC